MPQKQISISTIIDQKWNESKKKTTTIHGQNWSIINVKKNK